MKTILGFFKPFKLPIIIAFLLTLVELAAELLFPLFLGIMIDQAILPMRQDKILFWGIIMVIVAVVAFLSGIINSYYAAHVSTATAYNIRESLFSHIQRFSYSQLNRFPTAMLMTRFTNDVRQIQQTTFMSLRIMMKSPLMVIGSVIMALIINPRISLIFLITVPVLILFLYWVLQKGSRLFQIVQSRVDHVNRVIQENIAGMKIIRAFVRRDHEINRFANTNEQLQKETRYAFRFVESSMPVLLFAMNISLIFILWFGHKQSLAGEVAVGDVVAIVNYALRTVMMMSMFTFIALAFSRAKASSERVEDVLLEKVIPEPKIEEKPNVLIKGRVDVQDVTFTYPNSHQPMLRGISFSVAPNETIAIIGATGSGKTTFFQLLPRLYEPDDGKILLDGQPLSSYSVEQLREQIGYVSQVPLLFSGTIKDNITFGQKHATEKAMIQAAKDAQIHDSIMSFPNGYDTIVGQKGVNLSGGQKQRITIARALIRNPKILMLDDSTSALDMTTEQHLLARLDTYPCTTFIITQKVSTAQRADRIILLDKGQILHIGTHEELLNSAELYQKIVASQADKEVFQHG